MSISRTAQIDSLQVARAIAALLVVTHHSIRSYTLRAPDYWIKPALVDNPAFYAGLAVGVDIFFVISGFIMVYISEPYLDSQRPVSQFLCRRVLRIYPPYILVTLGLIIGFLLTPYQSSAIAYNLQLDRIISSLLLIPYFGTHGGVAPMLDVGWTLSYEIYFYLCFCLSIAISKRHHLIFLVMILTASILISRSTDTLNAPISFLKNTIVIEFLFGCVIALLYKRRILCPFPNLLLFCSIGFFCISCIWEMSNDYRFLTWGLPSALFVFGLLSMEKTKKKHWPKWALLLGDASFAIYLLHMSSIHVAKGLSEITAATLHSSVISLLVVLLTIVFAAFTGVLFYLFFEKNLNQRLKKYCS